MAFFFAHRPYSTLHNVAYEKCFLSDPRRVAAQGRSVHRVQLLQRDAQFVAGTQGGHPHHVAYASRVISHMGGAGPPPVQTEALQSCDFPGNVRELNNLMERACALSIDDCGELIHQHRVLNAALVFLDKVEVPDSLKESTRHHVKCVCGKMQPQYHQGRQGAGRLQKNCEKASGARRGSAQRADCHTTTCTPERLAIATP